MADSKITDLPFAITVNDGDALYIVQSATDKQVSGSVLKSVFATTAQLAAITPASIGAVATSQIGSFATTAQTAALSADIVAVSSAVIAITPSALGAIPTSSYLFLATTAQVAAITPGSIGAIPTSQIGSWITTDQLGSLATTAQVAAITAQSLGAATTAQIQGLATTAQVAAITAQSLGALTTAQAGDFIATSALSFLATTAQLSAITAASLNAMVTSERSHYVTTTAFAALTPAQIGAMATSERASLAYLASPVFTGNPEAPTAAAGTNTTQIATTAFTLANSGDRYLTTSTTTNTINMTSPKTFYVGTGLSYTPTQDATVVWDSSPLTAHMHSTVVSYNITTGELVLDITDATGSGSYSNWTINVGGLTTVDGALLSANNLSDVSSTSASLTNLGGVSTSRSILSGAGILGGGDFTADRTLSVDFSVVASTASVAAITPALIGAVSTSDIIAISKGGTGTTSQQAALTALTGTQVSGQYLRSNGTDTSLSSLLASDLTDTVAIAAGGTGASNAGAARLNLGIPAHYATIRASSAQTPIAMAGPYSASVTTGTTLVTLTTGDTSLLAVGMTFGTTGLLVCAIASITNSTQFVLSANATTTLTATSITVYNTSNTTLTYPAGAQAAIEGHTVAVGDVVFFSAQPTTPTMGPWQCSVAGAVGVSQVMVRPSFFTGTVSPQLNIIQRGTTSQGVGYLVYPTTAVDADIVVGQTPLANANSLIKSQPAILSTNTFTSTQTLATNTTTVYPLRFGTGVSQPLLTTPLASAVEYDGTYAYLTPATTVARRGLADGVAFSMMVCQTAAMAVATPTATTLTFAVGVQAAIDGHNTIALYDTVLLTNQALPAQNGPWIVTTLGTASVAAIWTRPGWFQGSTVRSGMKFHIFRGTVNQGTIRVCQPATNSDSDITVGTTALTFPLVQTSTVLINAQTGTTYTVALSDAGSSITANNAAAIAVSIPTNATAPFAVGAQILVIQLGAGQITFAAVTPGTTTVVGRNGLKSAGQYSMVSLVKIATDTWLISGDTSF